jgi:hypothetical protein
MEYMQSYHAWGHIVPQDTNNILFYLYKVDMHQQDKNYMFLETNNVDNIQLGIWCM